MQKILLALLFFYLSISVSIKAQENSKPEFENARIAPIARTCINCHGSAQNPAQNIPPLYGRDADDLWQRLQSFRQSDKDNSASIMPRLLGDLNEDQLKALSLWFSQH